MKEKLTKSEFRQSVIDWGTAAAKAAGLFLGMTAVSHASGGGSIIDTSDIQAQGNALIPLFIWFGTIVCIASIIFSVFRLRGGRMMEGIGELAGGIFGLWVIAKTQGWATGITGASLS